MPPDLRDSPEFKARNDLYNRKFQEIQEMEDAIESGQATDSMLRQTRPGLGIGTNPARRTQTR
jgi:hypothetical protein